MTEITSPISSTNANASTTIPTTTTTITQPDIPPDNNNSSEYQRSFSWKLPMVKVNRPVERKKSEYQREFTWKNDPPSTPSPAPSPAPITPSPIPQEFTCNTPEPLKSISTTTSNNNNIDFIGSKLNDLNITNNTININNNFVSEPEEYVFNTNNNVPDKWKDGLRSKNSPEPRQSVLASSLDPRTKKIVALEANRLSKKSRSYSMYSLHDQLKVNETAVELSSPFDTEYNREFVNWKEYGTTVREDTMANKKRQTTTDDHTLKRRGSWCAPASASLPPALKWLEDINKDSGSRANTRERLQPTIIDSKSIRGISTTITAKSQPRLNRDYYYDEKRPTTSAEIRDYHYDRPTTSADVRRPMTSLRDYDDNDYYNNSKRNSNLDFSYSKKDRNLSPLRSSTTIGYYNDNVTSKYYDNRERSSNISRDYDYYDRKYDDRRREDIYDDHKSKNVYDDRRREDIYDDHKGRNVYDDSRREDIYDDHKSKGVYDEHRREDIKNTYDDRRRDFVQYEDRRKDYVHNDRQRDSSPSYDYRRDNNNNNDYEGYDSKYRSIQGSDQEYFNPGHSRNASYASSNKGSVHDEPMNFSGAPLTYLDKIKHRSSVSSLSSVSTPSSPATPISYDMNDMRWKRNNGLDPRIYKEQNYSPSVISKSSSSSHKYWQFEDEKDKYYHHQSALSPSRSKFYMEEEDDDDEHLGGYSSKRQSRDYKSSSMRYSSQYSPSQTRSTSPSRDSYSGSSRKYYQKSANSSSRPASRATSVSSHATSIEEESAVLTDLLKEAELMTLKNLTDQMSIFKARDFGASVANPGRATPAVSGRATPAVSGRATPAVSGRATPSVNAAKRSSLGGQKKPTTTTTTTTRAGVRSKTTPTKTPTKTSTKTGSATTTNTTKGIKNSSTSGIPPNKKKGHRPASSLSSTSSYREAYQPPFVPPPTNFSAARDALSRARMKVEEMLEIVSNGGSLD